MGFGSESQINGQVHLKIQCSLKAAQALLLLKTMLQNFWKLLPKTTNIISMRTCQAILNTFFLTKILWGLGHHKIFKLFLTINLVHDRQGLFLKE